MKRAVSILYLTYFSSPNIIIDNTFFIVKLIVLTAVEKRIVK